LVHRKGNNTSFQNSMHKRQGARQFVDADNIKDVF